ncbi:MAG: hypothetical protein COA87_021390 [Halomonas sp.]|nr:hypothetical protein [Halomonas sp.]MBL1270245.1 hypothetical protein [Halomonas sp.]
MLTVLSGIDHISVVLDTNDPTIDTVQPGIERLVDFGAWNAQVSHGLRKLYASAGIVVIGNGCPSDKSGGDCNSGGDQSKVFHL